MDMKTEYESTDLEDSVKKEFYEKIEEDSRWCDEENGMYEASKKICKKRKKYQKIDNETRMKIIEEVQKNGKLLKNAAEKYNVNYSSAKSIFHVYRKEGRIMKKPFKGRTSKTIYQMSNPVVFVNLPNQDTSSSQNMSNRNYEESKGFYSHAWHQMPSTESVNVERPINTDTVPTNIVSILHPATASMLQSFCNQNISISNWPLMPMNQHAVEQTRNHLVKPNQCLTQKVHYYHIPNQYNYHQYNTRMGFLPGLQEVSPVSESEPLRKACSINQLVKKQWKFIDMGL